jgi:hypothetical protein
MGLKRRLRRLEEGRAMREQTPSAAEERRRLVREQAEHVNRCRDRDEQPVFEITADGDVLCAHDGRPVTDPSQTLAERFYRMELGWGGPGLVHDEEAEAFYTPEGELAVSRDRVDLRHLMGKEREWRWASGIR